MAAEIQGTAHVFGHTGATLSNLTLISFSPQKGFELDQTTTDEDGVVIETRKDSAVIRATLEAYMRANYTIPAQGDALVISGYKDNAVNTTYEIESVGQTYTQGEKVRITLNLIKHANITVS